ncbi:hypothetical protein GPECTOR_20g520 [Gonium pectorale]|uniref:BTB domain-containing protein n=1 Tax=Gonium pectorale TaxID=33097 RepID=A0A150GIP1_GONPE|nr:hypothetical protein GPECTOR_20g520 [Gonium pectorale]|eukprot:KXZ49663.1 hypothetical protein GPECTOR_20g520 [Gonium pectorale]
MQSYEKPLPKAATGIVVRPYRGSFQAIVFLGNEIAELHWDAVSSFSLGQRISVVGCLACARRPVYEPVTDSIYFIDASSILRLDSQNFVSPVVVGEDMRALAADGAGTLYVALSTRIAKVSVAHVPRSGPATGCVLVEAANSTAPPETAWSSLSYDFASGVLLAATRHAVYRGHPGTRLEMVAGSSSRPQSSIFGAPASARADGCGSDATFDDITGILCDGDGRLYIADGTALREMSSPGYHVHTLVANCVGVSARLCGNAYLAILPSGWLAVPADSTIKMLGPGFKPLPLSKQGASRLGPGLPPLPVPLSEMAKYLLASPGGGGTEAGGSGSSGGHDGGPGASPVLTIRVGDRAFVAHRALLADRCEFFKRLLAREGFAESGADEMALPEADPDVFGLLLGWVYWGVLEVPDHLLRPTAELAGRLLMPGVCAELQERLLAAVTPATAVGDLLWAERHSMTGLVSELKGFFARRLGEVVAAAPDALDELTRESPALAAELFRAVGRTLGGGGGGGGAEADAEASRRGAARGRSWRARAAAEVPGF